MTVVLRDDRIDVIRRISIFLAVAELIKVSVPVALTDDKLDVI